MAIKNTMGSNRTFMELKFVYLTEVSPERVCSNRTFMELKLISRYIVILAFFCSNRTFMELKFKDHTLQTKEHEVLIVPLWN